MVKGLEIFREHFREFTDRYVIIGGTACDLAMGEVGLPFRATKDIDIVLHVEVLDKEFVEAFWAFVQDGKYQIRETSTGKRQYYRFQKPATEGYPVMLELLSRVPDALPRPASGHLTPIPIDEDVSSLSAILLDDDYYAFLRTGIKEKDGLSYLGAEHLLPFKAKAWLNLSGGDGKSKDIDKHKKDVFRLYQIVNPDFDGEIPDTIKEDLRNFFSRMKEEQIDFKNLGLVGTDLNTVDAEIRKIYDLD